MDPLLGRPWHFINDAYLLSQGEKVHAPFYGKLKLERAVGHLSLMQPNVAFMVLHCTRWPHTEWDNGESILRRGY